MGDEAAAAGSSSVVGRGVEEVRSALNEHADVVAELFGRVSFELRTGFAPAVDSFIGFFHAVDWKSFGSTGSVTGLGVFLMDKAGRRPLLMVSAAGTCLGCILVGLSFLAKEHHWEKDLNIVLTLAGILIFPINMKGTAGSLVTLVNWLGSWIVSYAFNFLLVWNPYGTFFFFASICGLTVVFVERLVLETKGRTLEEIQASFHK